MKFAIFENNKIEATKGAKGFCPSCNLELIAKCGEIKIAHWSHNKIRNCDAWWENETEWHRSWKNNYPVDWQESIKVNELTGEKHIADICASHGLVIEFQHSFITSQERTSRENFYKEMVWVVDGNRLKRDFARFEKRKKDFLRTNKQGHYFVEFLDECFPANWLESSVPVVFDFLGMESLDNSMDLRNYLYLLLPKQSIMGGVFIIISRESFISSTINGDFLKPQTQPQNPTVKPTTQTNKIQNRESTHYYDHRQKRFVKRWRF